MIKKAFTLLACGVASACLISGSALAQSATVSTNPPAYGQGNQSLSQTATGGLRVQPQDGAGNDVSSSHPLSVSVTPSSTGSTLIAADVVTLPGAAAITMFATGHCANGCRVSVPVAFCTNPLTAVVSLAATTTGTECWQPNQSVPMPPTAHAISVYSTTASTASGIGSTVP